MVVGRGRPSGRPASDLADTFALLRDILAAQSKRFIVTVDKPGDYQVEGNVAGIRQPDKRA